MHSRLLRQILIGFGLFAMGLMLAAANLDPGLPDGYWDHPVASAGKPPSDWSALESNLHPEACAQCHEAQFALWKSSLHAHAYSSGMIGQFPDMGSEEGNNCLICHAPLASQRYRDDRDMGHSLVQKLAHPEGFDRTGDPDQAALPLRHSGVSCAVCHVRGWKRFGPPPKTSGAVGWQNGAAHGGFTATKAFEQSQFCASCHQFPESMAINGKPLENTLSEWKQSPFSDKGVTCQQCHMPERRHEFRGIHDAEMVRKGVSFELVQRQHDAVFTMTSHWIGHAFPTYVTPKIVVSATAFDSAGQSLHQWQWEIVREVEYDNGWKEIRDTRLMPGEHRQFVAAGLPAATSRVGFRVRVIPDHFYKGVYIGLLSDTMEEVARTHIDQALKRAEGNDYILYEQQLSISRQ